MSAPIDLASLTPAERRTLHLLGEVGTLYRDRHGRWITRGGDSWASTRTLNALDRLGLVWCMADDRAVLTNAGRAACAAADRETAS